MARIHLSQADVTDREEQYVLAALRSGWVAPLGPDVDAFEAEMAARAGVRGALAVSSGTAGLHLGLLGLGAGPGSVVVCASLTFAASANAVVYTGATPVFVDADVADGNVDPELLLEAVDQLQSEGVRVAAALVVDIFGRCADYDALTAELARREVLLLEDAAEALGSTYRGRPAGSFGHAAVLSFNGNKVMTTSGGGMLLSDNQDLLDRARYLGNQARQPVDWYEHVEVGYNYRLSNILAALGRAQLTRLDEMVERRRLVRERYRTGLADLPGIRFIGADSDATRRDNCWLTCIELDPQRSVLTPDELVAKMRAEDIEIRQVWKPMHLQPAFRRQRAFVTGSAERLFRGGVALPSGSRLADEDISRVIAAVQMALAT